MQSKISDFTNKMSEGFHEVNEVNKGLLLRNQFSYDTDIENYELIYSGPHFFVNNPFYKNPRVQCKINLDYDIIDLNLVDDKFSPKSNFKPSDAILLKNQILGLDDNQEKLWIDYFKLCTTNLLSTTGERTLQSTILPPKVSHIQGLVSIIFNDNKVLVEMCGLESSIIFDFLIKTIAVPKMSKSVINSFPVGVEDIYQPHLFTAPFNSIASINTTHLYGKKVGKNYLKKIFGANKIPD